MKYLDKSMTLNEIVEKFPETIDFFTSKGFKGLDDEALRKKVGTLKLSMALSMKKINVDSFMGMLEDIIEQTRNSADVNLNTSEKFEEGISVMGLLPCPVKNPLLEGLQKFQRKTGAKINHELKAASSGLDWLKEDVLKA